ncbi:hypothetical protein RAA17_12050 [Komagataeibacter rhaeticus]|nr:hypothetical protein [Komagataeibacter rhaeticus]
MSKNTAEPLRFTIGLDEQGNVIDCTPSDGKFRPCPPGYSPARLVAVSTDASARMKNLLTEHQRVRINRRVMQNHAGRRGL